ncbi:MAG: c-type cytochrome biogenesis protein CcmI, partial [Rhizobiales bacterium]|nr:c-type cytochrome biogenesis protein CcmI [Rhizobacter sp.]
MTTFALGVACLLALAAWMLRPAWRRPVQTSAGARAPHIGIIGEQLAALDREHAAGELDVQQHHAARTELQRRVLEETSADAISVDDRPLRKTLLGVLVALPLFAIALYGAIGNPAGLAVEPPPQAAGAEVEPEALDAMLATLAKRLETPSANPATDLQGWTMLARAYAGLQRFADADRAYARAIALAPNDAQLIADRADVLAVLQGGRTGGEPDRLIAQALQIDPRNLKALALAGSAAYERQDFATARIQWQKARDLAPAGSAFAAGLDRSLSEVGATA